MKICIPVLEEKELESKVSAHFGSAPFFMIIDSETKEVKMIKNNNQHHSHGMCQPLASLSNEEFDGIIVGGIGAGAVNKLNAAGIKVMKSTAADVAGVLEAHAKNDLEEVTVKNSCSNHSCN